MFSLFREHIVGYGITIQADRAQMGIIPAFTGLKLPTTNNTTGFLLSIAIH